MPLLTDRQCRMFLKDIREFGYPDVTFDCVRNLADDIHAGKDVKSNAIGIMLHQIISEVMEAKT